MFFRNMKLLISGLVIILLGTGVISIVANATGIKTGPIGEPNPQLDFKGVTIRAVVSTNGGDPVYRMYGPLLEKECGVKILRTELVDLMKLREKVMMDILVGEPSWQLVEVRAAFMVDFARTGKMECLDPYFEEYDQDEVKAYLNDILPPYREFYMKFQNHIYAIPYDGDVLTWNYVKTYFEDPKYKEEFRKEYGKELRLPETWDDVLLLCRFFKRVAPKGVYPIEFWVKPVDGAYMFFNIAASYLCSSRDKWLCRDNRGLVCWKNYNAAMVDGS